MSKYYSKKLSAERLQLCYQLAPPRVQQYLDAEISAILERVKTNELVLELGCGYGRVLQKVKTKTKYLYGVDTSRDNLRYAKDKFLTSPYFHLLEMDALHLGFSSCSFDLVFCVQNGISAFGVNPVMLIHEAIRITKSGGRVLFSSYFNAFWEERLNWFQIQSDHGLIGEIDLSKSSRGEIYCKDGFRSATFGEHSFRSLTSLLNYEVKIYEIDRSCSGQ